MEYLAHAIQCTTPSEILIFPKGETKFQMVNKATWSISQDLKFFWFHPNFTHFHLILQLQPLPILNSEE
jgi:hypothetical protein